MACSYVIQNGTIYDGLGGEGYSGTLLIEEGKIEKINPTPEDYPADAEVIDAEGLWVMPGFYRYSYPLRCRGRDSSRTF